MAITAQLVKDLREKTGAGMMDCKKALAEVNGDIDAAIDYLRKQGLQAMSRKASRVAAEGRVAAYVSGDEKLGVVLELNSETDFVAKNEEFIALADKCAQLVAEKRPSSVEELSALDIDGVSVNDKLNLLISKIGEKMSLRRFEVLEANANEKIGSYIHLGSKIGVLAKIAGNADVSLIKDVAMHVAAASPRFLNKTDIPQDVIDKEKDIFREQLKASGKPDNIIDKILEGKVAKFANEVCLNEQIFVKDPSGKSTVDKFIKEQDASNTITQFVRYQVGEGMEKKSDNFAEEVAQMAK